MHRGACVHRPEASLVLSGLPLLDVDAESLEVAPSPADVLVNGTRAQVPLTSTSASKGHHLRREGDGD